MVLVPGDTNITLAGALATIKLGIPVAHLEAGCRNFDAGMPEEVNHSLTDHCSYVVFAVSNWCRNRLIDERITEDNKHLVGDTMYKSIWNHRQDIRKDPILRDLEIGEEYYMLMVHKAENTDEPERLSNIFCALIRLEEAVIFPFHPWTSQRLEKTGLVK